MTSIKAKGIKDGTEIQVLCVEDDPPLFLFKLIKDPVMEQEMRNLMKQRFLIAGTYSPEENSMLNVLNILQYHFFDEPPEIETEGEFEEMPGEPGVVY